MRTRELVAMDGTETNFKELYNDEGKYMSTVSKKYKPVLHGTVVNLAENAVDQQGIGYDKKIMLTNNGRDLTYHMTMKGFGDEIAPQLVIQNTYKAGKALKLIQGQLTMVCSNGMVSGDKHSIFTHTHVRHLDQVLFNTYITSFLENHSKKVEFLNSLKDVEASPTFIFEFFSAEKDIMSATDEGKITDMWDHRQTRNVFDNRSGASVNDFYNTMTEYFTHQSKISMQGKIKRLTDIDNRIQELTLA